MLKISAFDLRDVWSPLENLLCYIGLIITFDLITLDCNGKQDSNEYIILTHTQVLRKGMEIISTLLSEETSANRAKIFRNAVTVCVW